MRFSEWAHWQISKCDTLVSGLCQLRCRKCQNQSIKLKNPKDEKFQSINGQSGVPSRTALQPLSGRFHFFLFVRSFVVKSRISFPLTGGPGDFVVTGNQAERVITLSTGGGHGGNGSGAASGQLRRRQNALVADESSPCTCKSHFVAPNTLHIRQYWTRRIIGPIYIYLSTLR